MVWWRGLQKLGWAEVKADGYVLAAVQSEQNRFALGGTLFSPMENRMKKHPLNMGTPADSDRQEKWRDELLYQIPTNFSHARFVVRLDGMKKRDTIPIPLVMLERLC